MTYDYETIKAMGKDERDVLYKELTAVLDRYDVSSDEWDTAYDTYCLLTNIMDEEYRQENMASFRAYEAKMHEPDFDWGFYSDWHKDMFGYRPHYDRIPANEEEREAMFHKFHAERGF